MARPHLEAGGGGGVLHQRGRRSRRCAVKPVRRRLWHGHWLRSGGESLRRPCDRSLSAERDDKSPIGAAVHYPSTV